MGRNDVTARAAEPALCQNCRHFRLAAGCRWIGQCLSPASVFWIGNQPQHPITDRGSTCEEHEPLES